MKISLRLFFFFVSLISVNLWAQAPARPPVAPQSLENSSQKAPLEALTLKALIERGLAYSPEVKQAEADYKIAREDYSQTESQIFPVLQLRASALNRKLVLSNFGQTGFTRQNQYSAALELSQPLYVGGAITSGLSSAKLGQDLARQKLFVQKQEYLNTLISTYYEYAESVERLKQAEINRDFLKNYAQIAKQYASIGRTKSIDRLQAEANLASSESSVLENESLAETSRNKLVEVIGAQEEQDNEFKVVSKLSIQPIEPMSLKEALDKSLANNPEILQAQIELKRQEYLNDLNLIEDRPRLTLDGSYGYVSPNRDEWFVEERNNYSVGLNLVIPLFSGLSSFSKKRENAELLFQKEKELELTRASLRESLSTALKTLDRDFKRIQSLKKAVELGRKAMDSALRDYRRGLVSSTDVVAIQNNRFQSEVNLLKVSASYMKQVLSLRKDLGVDLEKAYVF